MNHRPSKSPIVVLAAIAALAVACSSDSEPANDDGGGGGDSGGGGTGTGSNALVCDDIEGTWSLAYDGTEGPLDHGMNITVGAMSGEVDVQLDLSAGGDSCDGTSSPIQPSGSGTFDAATCTLEVELSHSWTECGEEWQRVWDYALVIDGDSLSGTIDYGNTWDPEPALTYVTVDLTGSRTAP